MKSRAPGQLPVATAILAWMWGCGDATTPGPGATPSNEAGGSVSPAPTAPPVSIRGFTHAGDGSILPGVEVCLDNGVLRTRQAARAEPSLEIPGGCSTSHFARHCGSPRHAPTHVAYGAHEAVNAQTDDSWQQLAAAHDAHSRVPYGKPQTLRTSASGCPDGASSKPTICRHATRLPAAAVQRSAAAHGVMTQPP